MPDDPRSGDRGPEPAEGPASVEFRSGFVAVFGRPNVGKSTLVNALVGRKVSIVSDHPQTTRRRITGVVTLDDCQVVLLDLPGFQKPFDSLTRRMQTTVDDALEEVDAALVLLNATETFGAGDRYITQAVARAGLPRRGRAQQDRPRGRAAAARRASRRRARSPGRPACCPSRRCAGTGSPTCSPA